MNNALINLLFQVSLYHIYLLCEILIIKLLIKVNQDYLFTFLYPHHPNYFIQLSRHVRRLTLVFVNFFLIFHMNFHAENIHIIFILHLTEYLDYVVEQY